MGVWLPVCRDIGEGTSGVGVLPHQASQFPHGKIRQNWVAEWSSPSLQGFPESLTTEGRKFRPERQVNDEESWKSCSPQLPLCGVPATDPNLRMPSPPRPGRRGGSSSIWPQSSSLTNWERSGPRSPSCPAGLATFLGAGGGGRSRDGTRARGRRERQGQVGPRVTPPLPQGPQQVDSAHGAAQGPQAHPE